VKPAVLIILRVSNVKRAGLRRIIHSPPGISYHLAAVMHVNDVNLGTIKPQLYSLESMGHLSEWRILSRPCCRVLNHSDWTMLHFRTPDSSSACQYRSLWRDGMSNEPISGFRMCSVFTFTLLFQGK